MPGKRRKTRDIEAIKQKKALIEELQSGKELSYEEIKAKYPKLTPKQILGIIGFIRSPISKALNPPTSTPTAKTASNPTLNTQTAGPEPPHSQASSQAKASLDELPGSTPSMTKPSLSKPSKTEKPIEKTSATSPITNKNKVEDSVLSPNKVGDTVLTPEKSIGDTTSEKQANKPSRHSLTKLIPSTSETFSMELVEKEILAVATPIVRKVVLNPAVYLWYDYARNRLGYKGDLGDFLVDCVEDFFRSRGYKIKIVHEEEVVGG